MDDGLAIIQIWLEIQFILFDTLKSIASAYDATNKPLARMDSVKKLMEELLRKVKPQPDFLELILTNPDLYNRAKELGMFGAWEPKVGSSNISLEIEKLLEESYLKHKKMELEYRKMYLEDKLKDSDFQNDIMKSIMSAIAPIAKG